MPVKQIIQTLGGPTAIARHLGVRSQAVSLWALNNRIPAERVPELERMARRLGVDVRAEDMRPDIAWDVLRSQS
jgi:DNA-binding transcriptional regulator YdaS (Cro superfamily)